MWHTPRAVVPRNAACAALASSLLWTVDMKKRPPLRPSFVVTLAATTALGCGASVSVNPPQVTDDVPVADRPPTDTPVVIETDVRRACPSTLPVADSSCTPGVDPEVCTDATRTQPGCPPGIGVSVRCDPSTRRWQPLPTTCNPPPPVQCPSARPENDAACPTGTYLTTPLRCSYDRCGEHYSTEASCDGPTARWRVLRSSCNPPFPDAGFGTDT